MIDRRGFITYITGAAGVLAAPSIVRCESLMKVKEYKVNGIRFISSLGPLYDKPVKYGSSQLYIKDSFLYGTPEEWIYEYKQLPARCFDTVIKEQTILGWNDWRYI